MMTILIQKNERNDSPAGNFDSKLPREPGNRRNHRLPIAAYGRNQRRVEGWKVRKRQKKNEARLRASNSNSTMIKVKRFSEFFYFFFNPPSFLSLDVQEGGEICLLPTVK